MAAHFVNIDYDTPLILPPNPRDWLPPGHLAHFILDAVEEMDLRRHPSGPRHDLHFPAREQSAAA
jgi:hypothetical protein